MSVDWEAIRAKEIELVTASVKALNLGVSQVIGYPDVPYDHAVSNAYARALADLPSSVVRALIDLRHEIFVEAQKVVA